MRSCRHETSIPRRSTATCSRTAILCFEASLHEGPACAEMPNSQRKSTSCEDVTWRRCWAVGPDTAERVKSLAASIENLEVAQGGRKEPRGRPTIPTEVLKNACRSLPSDAALIKFIAYDRTSKGKAFEEPNPPTRP